METKSCLAVFNFLGFLNLWVAAGESVCTLLVGSPPPCFLRCSVVSLMHRDSPGDVSSLPSCFSSRLQLSFLLSLSSSSIKPRGGLSAINTYLIKKGKSLLEHVGGLSCPLFAWRNVRICNPIARDFWSFWSTIKMIIKALNSAVKHVILLMTRSTELGVCPMWNITHNLHPSMKFNIK